jgi:hypothetical protein
MVFSWFGVENFCTVDPHDDFESDSRFTTIERCEPLSPAVGASAQDPDAQYRGDDPQKYDDPPVLSRRKLRSIDRHRNHLFGCSAGAPPNEILVRRRE